MIAYTKAVGDDFTLMIDPLVHPGNYTRQEVLMVDRVLDELNFLWFEGPLPETDLDGLAELAKACKLYRSGWEAEYKTSLNTAR
jgi:L-alanine-DL-glutamate epimerase-like enolase superfamily enzyme